MPNVLPENRRGISKLELNYLFPERMMTHTEKYVGFDIAYNAFIKGEPFTKELIQMIFPYRTSSTDRINFIKRVSELFVIMSNKKRKNILIQTTCVKTSHLIEHGNLNDLKVMRNLKLVEQVKNLTFD